MKKIITINSMLIGVVFLVGCAINKTPPTTPVPLMQQPMNKQSAAIQPNPTTPTTQSTDETENWQTYQNARFGFEFKYPKGSTPFSEIDEKNELQKSNYDHSNRLTNIQK